MAQRPDFRLAQPNPNRQFVTDAEWWLWLQLRGLEPSSRLGGIYADKSGYHNTGNANEQGWPGNYSVRDAPDRRGPWWRTKASALDWTFPDAQRGDYRTISRYTSRLAASARNASDPRLDGVLREFFGQSDTDRQVEGWDERYEEAASSDSSHLWHIHFSFIRDRCGDFWAMWALLTVLMGWSVQQWRGSLAPPVPAPPPPRRPKSILPIVLKEPSMPTAFVQFFTDPTDENAQPIHPDIYCIYENGVVRAALPAEWNNRGSTPVWREYVTQLPRYQQYDNALRDADVDVED
jgi:hypothetical protein